MNMRRVIVYASLILLFASPSVFLFIEHEGVDENEIASENKLSDLIPETSVEEDDSSGTDVANKPTRSAAPGRGRLDPKSAAAVSRKIEDAVASGDPALISRAFNDVIYDKRTNIEQAIKEFKQLLDHPNLEVRWQAAEGLYITGHDDGYETLLEILQTPHEVEAALYDGDLRVKVIDIFGTFREFRAGEAVLEFCVNNPQERSQYIMIDALGILAPDGAGDAVWQRFGNQMADSLAICYGRLKYEPARKTMEQRLENNERIPVDEKAALIWALHSMSTKAKNIYTVEGLEIAQKAVLAETPSKYPRVLSRNNNTEAFRVIASIKDPAIRSLLEETLATTDNHTLIELAAVNLVLHWEGESAELDAFLIKQFDGLLAGDLPNLPFDMLMRITAQSSNQQVHNLARKYSDWSSNGRYEYWSVDRADWPVYSWADDYTIFSTNQSQ